MYILVKENEGVYYYSVAFGFYCQAGIHNRFFYVLNKEKTALVKKRVFERGKKYLDPMALIVDADDSDWHNLSESRGCIDFLDKYPLELLDKQISEEDLSRCIAIDAGFHYDERREIHSEKDIYDFMTATGCLHDAEVIYSDQLGDSLYLRFSGTWGCEVEVWFAGHVAYDMTNRDPKNYSPYWTDSSLFIEDGFIFLVDYGEVTSAGKITGGDSWFKAKSMEYRIIPVWIKQDT